MKTITTFTEKEMIAFPLKKKTELEKTLKL